jgi:hypothetical protein
MSELAFTIGPSGNLATTADRPFVFRNRVAMGGNVRLDIDAIRLGLASVDMQETIALTACKVESRIKDAGCAILWGGAYSDSESALAAGRKWRQILLSVLARLGVGSDIGSDENPFLTDEDIAPLHISGMFDRGESERVYRDRPGLMVFELQPPPFFVMLSADAYGLIPFDSGGHLISLAEGRHAGVWTDELRLAYDLVHGSLSLPNPVAKYVLVVTAIEALIPYQERSEELSELLESLKPVVAQASNYDEDTRASVKKLLDSAKMHSVRQHAIKLVGRLTGGYDGKPPKKFFDEIYGVRSGLAHGNPRDKPSLSMEALDKQYPQVLGFVLDVLEAWTPDESIAESDSGDANSTDSPA